MKKLVPLLFAGMCLMISCAEDEPDCMKCYSEVTDTDTNVKTKGSKSTYCNEELDLKLRAKPINLDGSRSAWVCE